MRNLLWLLLIAQDSTAVERKIAELRDHAAAIEKCTEEILAFGPAAVESLRREVASAAGGVRERLSAILQEIERRERVREFQSSPALIALSAESRPLSEVMADIQRQCPAAILRAAPAVSKEPITAKIEGLPLLQALNELSQAHGGLVVRWPRRPDEPLSIEKGAFGKTPRAFAGLYGIELSSVTLSCTSDFGVDVADQIVLQFFVCWDKSVQPMSVRFVITRMTDEQGASYADAVVPSGVPAGRSWRQAPQQFSVVAGRRLPDRVRAFRLISGYLEVIFPCDVETLRIPAPVGRHEISLKGALTSFTMMDCARGDPGYACRLETEPGVDLRTRDIRLCGKDGRSWPGVFGRSTTDETSSVFQVSFGVPADADVAELCVSQAKPGAPQRIEWSLENVRVR